MRPVIDEPCGFPLRPCWHRWSCERSVPRQRGAVRQDLREPVPAAARAVPARSAGPGRGARCLLARPRL